MNLHQAISDVLAQYRADFDSASDGDQWTLGQLIDAFNVIVDKYGEKAPAVVFDFCYMHPTHLDSWRGVYSELALNYVEPSYTSPPLGAIRFLNLLKDADGYTFTGYKGGGYKMDRDTPVWVANSGDVGSTAVVGVLDMGYEIVLLTKYIAK